MADHLSSQVGPEKSVANNPVHLLRHNREELAYIVAEPLRTPALAARRTALRLRGKKPLGYLGWVGHRNLGDEAMYQVIQQAFSQFEMTPFVAPPGEKLLAQLGLGGAGFFRAFLLGGGTLISDIYLRTVQLARSFQAPIYPMGSGVGSPGFGFSRETPLVGWPEILRESPFVPVRGPVSESLLHEAGVPHAVAIGDPALGLTPDTAPPLRTRQRLAINLAQEPGSKHLMGDYAVFHHIGQLAKEFTRRGGEVVGVALGNGDRAVLATFRDVYGLAGMRIEEHRTEPEPLLRTLAGSVGLIGVRLHSAVLASCVGLPTILFAYRRKCEDFMASMGISEFAIPLSADTTYEILAERWRQLESQPALGERIYRTALSWKQAQRAMYCRIAEDILSADA